MDALLSCSILQAVIQLHIMMDTDMLIQVWAPSLLPALAQVWALSLVMILHRLIGRCHDPLNRWTVDLVNQVVRLQI